MKKYITAHSISVKSTSIHPACSEGDV